MMACIHNKKIVAAISQYSTISVQSRIQKASTTEAAEFSSELSQEEGAFHSGGYSFANVRVNANPPEGIQRKPAIGLMANRQPIQAKLNLGTVGGQRKQETTGKDIGASGMYQENKTGLPDKLKAGIETLSGISMDDVKVHYNSSKPSQLQALAYTQGRNIYVRSGQERYLGHEAWHVVQQKQGRVKPTTQAKGEPLNTEQGLEKEADEMGQKAIQMKCTQCEVPGKIKIENSKRGNATSVTPMQFTTSHQAIQRKSQFTKMVSEGSPKTPLETLNNTFLPYFQRQSLSHVLQYNFHGLQNISNDENKYLKAASDSRGVSQWQRPKRVEAQIDPKSKSDSKNRNNDIINPYGGFGTMERACNLRKHKQKVSYDGGHLVEHTLMDNWDADVHGNLAPQEGKHFNQLMYRGGERIAELYHPKLSFKYTVELEYDNLTYDVTAQELENEQVISSLLVASLPPPKQTKLRAEKLQFDSWIPRQWEPKLEVINPTDTFPQIFIPKGERYNNMYASAAAAEGAVLDKSKPIKPGLYSQPSMGAAFHLYSVDNTGTITSVGQANMTSGPMLVVGGSTIKTLGGQFHFSKPLHPTYQPHTTTLPTGSTAAVLPLITPNVNVLRNSLRISQIFNEIGAIKLTRLKWHSTKAKGRHQVEKKLTNAELDTGAKLLPSYSALRGPNSYLHNSEQGAAFIKAVNDVVRTNKKKAGTYGKVELIQAIRNAVGENAFRTLEDKNRLNQLIYDAKLKP